ncbi:Beta-lactamase-related protein [uncultured virus]|nr:Beta-lactamase-related protein [uncultured virus]
MADDFEGLFATNREVGAATAMYYNGCKIADLYGGTRKNTGELWTYNTKTNAFSAAKAIHAFSIAKMRDFTHYQNDDLVTDFDWEEFSQNGKENVTISILTSYRAGTIALPTVYYGQDSFDEEYMDNAIAAIVPFHNPNGSFAAYHATDMGNIIDALIRRMDPYGRNLEQFFREEIMTLPGLEEFEFYYYPDVSLDSEIAELTNETFRNLTRDQIVGLCSIPLATYKTICRSLIGPIDMNNNGSDVFLTNDPLVRNKSYTPSGFTWTTARSLAALYGIAANRKSRVNSGLISNKSFRKAIEEVFRGTDLLTGQEGSYTVAGFEYPTSGDQFSISSTAVGRTGLGGQSGFMDSEREGGDIGYAYVTRNMRSDSENSKSMMNSVYECAAILDEE